jgi:hypothetical protein
MSTQDIAEAKAAMQKAQEKLKDAEEAYNNAQQAYKEDFKRKNPTASEVDLLEFLELKLKTFNDNLKTFNDNLLSARQVYLEEIRGQQQQGIRIESHGRSECSSTRTEIY